MFERGKKAFFWFCVTVHTNLILHNLHSNYSFSKMIFMIFREKERQSNLKAIKIQLE